MTRSIQFKRTTALFITVLLLACFGFRQKTRAVSPTPDGGYPGGNTAEGQNALFSLTTGGYNTAVGLFSLRTDATGQLNTAVGAGTLLANTADENTATGAGALLSNSTGVSNTANGAFTLFSNTIGNSNTAIGALALEKNTTGNLNTATGVAALNKNTTGGDNTADGETALQENTTGGGNTAIGDAALFSNTTASLNTAMGGAALFVNTTGTANTATGHGALSSNSTGSNNIGLGADAGVNLTTGDYNIDVGNAGVAGEANTIRIGDDDHYGATFIGGIYSRPVSGLTVVMDSSDRLGTIGSSRRFKTDIKPIAQASETILSLEPVTFRYKKEIDPAGTPQFGLVAEEVEKVNPDLVVRDKEGKPYTVRYEAVNAMLLNEFLKEHRTVQELKTTVAQQQKQIDALTDGLQKVSALLELNKSAPQTVLNDQ